MCGILLSEEENSAWEEIALLVRNRGEDHYNRIHMGNIVAISSVLAIRESIKQPVVGHRYILLYNGEVYNKEPSDTLFIKSIVDKLLNDGADSCMESTIDRIYEEINRYENEMAMILMIGDYVYFFKDDIGRRSLGYGLSPFYVSSVGYLEEINPMLIYSYNKVTKSLSEWPKSSRIVKKYMSMSDVILKRLNNEKYSKKYQYLKKYLASSGVEANKEDLNNVDDVVKEFGKAFRKSVERRVSEGNICVFFSGGVDSMLVTIFLHYSTDPCQRIYLINTSFGPSWDRDTGKRGFESLCSRFRERAFIFVSNEVSIEEVRAFKEHIYKLIHPKCGRMDFNIGATLFFTARESRKYSKIGYLGSGADEMFGGYHRYKGGEFRGDMLFDLFTISHHNVCRDDRVISDNQVECRFPFLDSGMVEYSLRVGRDILMMNGDRKFVIREVLRREGFECVSKVPKKAMQYGSGIFKMEGKI
ncbi:asparagine synthetase-like protein [Encephalitozoon romaleae SJ-2008]|uniref:Asparagine synthetase-like protein n=1 Tax=Encephalitozoon romaleae (strain SJ-2008) TaxID=1178016 RepID=I6ZT89_ENCRO|nr:asparagine synthetase-like protein [Encephalitozoon romaleae SJ-2008]AFN82846.1 asparagine synthetase-like protein [Encephalitozoon romaleae SJ-2008]